MRVLLRRPIPLRSGVGNGATIGVYGVALFDFTFGVCKKDGVVVGNVGEGETVVFAFAEGLEFCFFGNACVFATSDFMNVHVKVVIQ